jgi:hypothetical protein
MPASHPSGALRNVDTTEQGCYLLTMTNANETKTARPSTYWKGDRAEYTGKTMMLHGGLFFEVEMMEGRLVGQLKVTMHGPNGERFA